MNAQEKLRRKRRKQLKRRLGFVIPIVVIILMVVGLTAGGIALSLNQSRQMSEDAGSKDAENDGTKSISDNTREDGSDEAGDQTEPEDASGDGTEEETGSTQPEVATTEEATLSESEKETQKFDALLAKLGMQLSTNSSTLSVLNSGFEDIVNELGGINTGLLEGSYLDIWQALSDHIAVEQEGKTYAESSPAAGTRLTDAPDGPAYYAYLLKKFSGTDYGVQDIYKLLEVEMNNAYSNVSAMVQTDPTLPQAAAAATKTSADTPYMFGTVTASSNRVLTQIASDGLVNGWAEFGLIRAYQMDPALSDALKSYQIERTRMTYALYGIMDITVHGNGGDLNSVVDLCNRYFGSYEEGFPASVYQYILDYPGRYAATGLGYLQLVEIETTLRNNTPDYSEQVLLDFLFGRGPATFRVYWSWLLPEEEAGTEGSSEQESLPGVG